MNKGLRVLTVNVGSLSTSSAFWQMLQVNISFQQKTLKYEGFTKNEINK